MAKNADEVIEEFKELFDNLTEAEQDLVRACVTGEGLDEAIDARMVELGFSGEESDDREV